MTAKGPVESADKIVKSVFCSPFRYTQGPGVTGGLGSEMVDVGLSGPVLVIASATPARVLGETWQSSFKEASLDHRVETFGGECSRIEIERLSRIARDLGAGSIVGAGGGKVIDTARAVSDACNLPVVSCPTVAASDASTSALSVIYTPEGNFETYVFYKHNPSLVLVDTRVIASAPVRFLSAGIGDGLATMYEADAVFKSGKLNFRGGHTTVTARVVAKACHDTLIEHGVQACDAVSRNALDDHVEKVVEANVLMSGLGFESVGVAAAHAIHNGLTMLAPTHEYLHGEKVAFGLIAQLFMERQDSALLEEVIRFCSSVNLPTTLADIGLDGVSDADLQKVAVRATQPDETIHNEPFEVTPPMVVDAIRQADTLGRSLAAS